MSDAPRCDKCRQPITARPHFCGSHTPRCDALQFAWGSLPTDDKWPDLARKLEREYGKDATRWRHCLNHGFPVYCPPAMASNAGTWSMKIGDNWFSYTSPEAAVDAGIAYEAV